ncbi:hypothetical protein D3C71_1844570 [compost metagenome]
MPYKRKSAFATGMPMAGKDTSRRVAGSLNPGTSPVTSRTIRVSTPLTPGKARISSATPAGARLRLANTSAKRWLT